MLIIENLFGTAWFFVFFNGRALPTGTRRRRRKVWRRVWMLRRRRGSFLLHICALNSSIPLASEEQQRQATPTDFEFGEH
jgi:hypothetical protein